MKGANTNRRRFLKTTVLGCLGAGAVAGRGLRGQDRADPDLDFEMEEEEAPRIRKYNNFGKTGLKVSDISLGIAQETSVLHYALDRGINLFDTAEGYYDGQHERDIGRAFAKMRDKVVVTTKHYIENPEKIKKQELINRFDESLKRLNFDYVDIAMMHAVQDPAQFKNEEILSAYESLKKAGKYRFLGFSTHDAENVCPPAFESKLFSAMMVIYNSVQYPDRSETIAKANELGIGVIAMKTMAGREQDKAPELADERTTYAQAAIKWALADKNVHNAVVSMRTFDHIDECLRASGQGLTTKEQAALRKYKEVAGNRFCRIGCVECVAACPAGVAIPDIMRFGMYYENYGNEKFAMQEYARLQSSKRARPCHGCSGFCEAACPHGLTIRERLRRYDGLLRV